MGKIFKYDVKNIKELSEEQFETLLKITRLLDSSNYQDYLIENIIDLIIQVVNAERGVFVKLNNEDRNPEIVAARNINKENIKDISEFSSGVIRQVIAKMRPVVYHDVQSDPGLSQFQSVHIKNIKSVIGVPVFYNNRVWGVILADTLSDRTEFTKQNLVFLNFLSNLISLSLQRVIRLEKLEHQKQLLENKLQSTSSIPDMIGESKAMRDTARLIHKVALSNANVLILGESGTGKDLTAQAIHKLSERKDKPFVAQFCGSIPDNLLESELFGYKKGAFTGADSDKKGLLEIADGGTFFLDEIAEVSLGVQAKLLRVIENKEMMRLGDPIVRKVDLRIIAATNKDLSSLVKKGKFRQDLYYRINVFPVKLPPLRERKGDIPLLADYFVRNLSGSRYYIDPDAIKKLENYYYPGNVRQLLNILQRAAILSDSQIIRQEHILFEEEEYDNFQGTLKDFEIKLLKKRLELFDGNKSLAAKSLGVSLRWVQMRLKDQQ
ncbi:MAG: sigma-54-dependent Fis family transcriptional regulator [Ignavibacteriaceae bacterium]